MENMYIFGLREDEVMARYRHQTGEVQALYASNMPLKRVLDQLIDGTLEPQQPQIFREIYHSLLFGDYGMADPYMVTRDFDAYIEAQAQLARDYQDKALWTKKAVLNTAASGYFSSDRTIEEYNEKIWRLTHI